MIVKIREIAQFTRAMPGISLVLHIITSTVPVTTKVNQYIEETLLSTTTLGTAASTQGDQEATRPSTTPVEHYTEATIPTSTTLGNQYTALSTQGGSKNCFKFKKDMWHISGKESSVLLWDFYFLALQLQRA